MASRFVMVELLEVEKNGRNCPLPKHLPFSLVVTVAVMVRLPPRQGTLLTDIRGGTFESRGFQGVTASIKNIRKSSRIL